jgi:hypothetical protein
MPVFSPNCYDLGRRHLFWTVNLIEHATRSSIPGADALMVLYGELCPLSPLSDVDNCRFDCPAENGEIEYPRIVVRRKVGDAGGCYPYESSKQVK